MSWKQFVRGEYLSIILTIMKIMIRTALFVTYNTLASTNSDNELHYIFRFTMFNVITKYAEKCL